MAFLVTIAGESFELILENNASAKAFAKLLPLELDMADVNGNEKFYLLADHLPRKEQCSCSIKTGDLLLCQTNELTFFYDDCTVHYMFPSLNASCSLGLSGTLRILIFFLSCSRPFKMPLSVSITTVSSFLV